MYYANALLDFQNPASPVRPINHGNQIVNGQCTAIKHLKSLLPDELVKGVSHNIQAESRQ